jgi:hypothetical protein
MLDMTRNLFEDVVSESQVRYQRVDKQLGTVGFFSLSVYLSLG